LTIFELPVKTKPWMVSMLWSALSNQDEANRWLRCSIKAISQKLNCPLNYTPHKNDLSLD